MSCRWESGGSDCQEVGGVWEGLHSLKGWGMGERGGGPMGNRYM